MPLTVVPIDGVDSLGPLAADAERDGRRMVEQLVREWTDGTNRFDERGERLYTAILDEGVAGVCGLNRDPFVQDESVGRVRRLYVATDARRRGVATALVRRLLADAGQWYERVHVRTHDEHADAFYRAIGFERVTGDEYCTHCRRLHVAHLRGELSR